ncbi:hypothetical protein CBL_14445 [Carabus blaptoides fortunei]
MAWVPRGATHRWTWVQGGNRETVGDCGSVWTGVPHDSMCQARRIKHKSSRITNFTDRLTVVIQSNEIYNGSASAYYEWSLRERLAEGPLSSIAFVPQDFVLCIRHSLFDFWKIPSEV